MKNITNSIIALFIGIQLVSCSTSTSETTDQAAPAVISTNSTAATSDSAQITGEFSFKIVEGEYSPMTTVSVLSNGQEYLVDEIVGGAMIIDKAEYESMGIPSTALSACGAWWAGGGDYFYLTQSNNQLIVYAGWLDEMEEQDNGYHWEERIRFP